MVCAAITDNGFNKLLMVFSNSANFTAQDVKQEDVAVENVLPLDSEETNIGDDLTQVQCNLPPHCRHAAHILSLVQ